MKKLVMSSLIGLAALGAAVPAAQAADVGVSISVGDPGFYGRIDLGNAPRPQLIYSQPVWVERAPVRMEPIYLRVPVGYERNWGRYCHRYDACGRPVYFVRDSWYRDVYAPHYRDHYYREGWHEARREGWYEARRDRDHDGVPDYRDRDGGHRRDRDNDGVPDRYDRHDHDNHRR